MKFKNIFFILYTVTVLYCYNVFAFEGEEVTSNLSFSDKIIVIILCMLAVVLVKGFKIKREIQE